MKKKSAFNPTGAVAEPATRKTAPKKNGKTNGEAGTPQNINLLKPEENFADHLDSRELLKVLTEVRNGNFSVRMPMDKIGLDGKICDILNDIISLN